MNSYKWQRYTFAERLVRYLIYLATVAVLVWSVSDLDIFWPWVWDAPVQIGDLFARMSPLNLSGLRQIGAALIETVHIATLATLLALVLALPTAYIAAQNTTPNRLLLWLGRLIVVSTRSVNTIIWALLFVAIFGPGVVAGILAIAFRSIGFIGKLMAEAIEEIDKRQIEAIEATGAGKGKVVLYGIVPQVLPAFFAVTILRWDINIRESTVLGLVGAGGIGLILQSSIDLFDWQTVATILIAILGVVILGELVSAALRRRVL
ncbi:MAG TPA: phosphonate ABC transporter, permease protein PhnE [Trueperaceae bacterium]|nr:phosphonate ABC transporter, permease protein PhnE [Trueperaceae bacterium]